LQDHAAMRKLAVFLVIMATLALVTTFGVLKARETETARKIDRIRARTYMLEGTGACRSVWDFKRQSGPIGGDELKDRLFRSGSPSHSNK
jgi:hypothetical protein